MATNIVLLLGATSPEPDPKSLTLRRFKSDRDEIWQNCSEMICL